MPAEPATPAQPGIQANKNKDPEYVTGSFPLGLEMDVSYPDFHVSLTLLPDTQLHFEIKEGPFARTEVVAIHVVPLGNGLFAFSWQEKDGATVTNVQDHDRGLVHSKATLPTGEFLRMTGTLTVTRPADAASDARPQRNKALVLEAMTVFLCELWV